MPTIELVVDVSDVVNIGEPAHTAATVYLPVGPLADPAVVCFAFPGGGYSRRYYALDATGYEPGGQAAFHTDRGWIFVTCDHLGFGDSTVPAVDVLDYDNIALGNLVTVQTVLAKLRDGELGDRAVVQPVTLGLGQSMGAASRSSCRVAMRRRRDQCARVQRDPHDSPAARHAAGGGPDRAGPISPTRSRKAQPRSPPRRAIARRRVVPPPPRPPSIRCGSFHYDDVTRRRRRNIYAGTDPGKPLPSWRWRRLLRGIYMVAGHGGARAASITSPVLSATGEATSCPTRGWSRRRSRVAPTSRSTCPRMGHMQYCRARVCSSGSASAWGSASLRPPEIGEGDDPQRPPHTPRPVRTRQRSRRSLHAMFGMVVSDPVSSRASAWRSDRHPGRAPQVVLVQGRTGAADTRILSQVSFRVDSLADLRVRCWRGSRGHRARARHGSSWACASATEYNMIEMRRHAVAGAPTVACRARPRPERRRDHGHHRAADRGRRRARRPRRLGA